MQTMDELANETANDVQNVIDRVIDNVKVGKYLVNLAKALVKDYDSKVPDKIEDLEALGVTDTVIGQVRQHIFGITELVFGLHVRKLCVATDLIDWEEFAPEKKKIKMAKVSGDRVRRSVSGWLPKGEGLNFQNTAEALCEALQRNEKGFWGKLKSIINKHFSIKDKKTVNAMINKICQFQKITKSGGQRKSCETDDAKPAHKESDADSDPDADKDDEADEAPGDEAGAA